jgi:hypothetical protein
MSSIGQITAYARFAVGLRRYLHEPATAELGREVIGRLLLERESSFLTLVRRAVYENERSPYLALLQMAGCEYGDLERMVRSDGIESTLTRLRDAGVYVTIDEFKCRKDIVRSSTEIHCEPQDFDNPFLHRSIATGSSGSRSPGTSTRMNLDRSRYHALNYTVVFSAHGLTGRPTLLCMPILPSAAGLGMLLQSSKMGVPPVRWFSPVQGRTIRPAIAKRLATLYAVYAGRLFGVPMPAPEYVSTDRTGLIADSLVGVLKRGQGCAVFASPSLSVRVCQSAHATGHSLSGATFIASGEPLTPAKMNEISSVGAGAVNLYAFAECGIVGFSCAGEKPVCDDIHLIRSSVAVIQRRRDTPYGGGSVDAFLFTSLFNKAPKILLNAESGDYGVLETRTCGCELGDLGFTQHLHTIRSFDKLTGEGMTFVGTDVVRIIEEVLPSRFGGFSIDYQMVELEDKEGRTRLNVLVSPAVGEVDEARVVDCVLAELSKGSDTNRMMAEIWRQGGTLRVQREPPHLTKGGKLLSLHIVRGGQVDP